MPVAASSAPVRSGEGRPSGDALSGIGRDNPARLLGGPGISGSCVSLWTTRVVLLSGASSATRCLPKAVGRATVWSLGPGPPSVRPGPGAARRLLRLLPQQSSPRALCASCAPSAWPAPFRSIGFGWVIGCADTRNLRMPIGKEQTTIGLFFGKATTCGWTAFGHTLAQVSRLWTLAGSPGKPSDKFWRGRTRFGVRQTRLVTTSEDDRDARLDIRSSVDRGPGSC
jgi:hypothetical protein